MQKVTADKCKNVKGPFTSEFSSSGVPYSALSGIKPPSMQVEAVVGSNKTFAFVMRADPPMVQVKWYTIDADTEITEKNMGNQHLNSLCAINATLTLFNITVEMEGAYQPRAIKWLGDEESVPINITFHLTVRNATGKFLKPNYSIQSIINILKFLTKVSREQCIIALISTDTSGSTVLYFRLC